MAASQVIGQMMILTDMLCNSIIQWLQAMLWADDDINGMLYNSTIQWLQAKLWGRWGY